MSAIADKCPSKRAFLAVEKMARDAAKRDHWMEPVDEYRSRDARTDYGVYEQDLIDGWEETDHFYILYGVRISELAEAQAERHGIRKYNGQWEWWYYEFYLPLKEAFWNEWIAKRRVYEFWKKHVATDTKDAI